MIDVIEACHPNGKVKTLDEIEADAIKYALARCKGSMTKAALVLGIGRSTLYRKVKEFGIAGP